MNDDRFRPAEPNLGVGGPNALEESGVNRRDILKRGAAVGGGLLAAGAGLRAADADAHGRHRHHHHPKPPPPQYQFPKRFLWGAGTSGLQHEGSPLADGAKPSMMYEWAHTPGKVPEGQTFDVTSDFYRRYREDIKLMKKLGLRAYNFEVYWPRILPDGKGKPNRSGLDYYDRLVDEFCDADIKPLCNLHVFDHPAALQVKGGWQNRDMAKWFAEYAAVLFDRLGDRVDLWTTVCETHFINHVSHTLGLFPPEIADVSVGLRTMHHMLLGEGLATEAFRASRARGDIGYQHLVIPVVAASDSEADAAAAVRADQYLNLLPLDAYHFGTYQEELIDFWGPKWPADAVKDGDLKQISTPKDFMGVDYYFGAVVRDAPTNPFGLLAADLQVQLVGRDGSPDPWSPGSPPTGLRDGLVFMRDRYGDQPIYLLELGTSLPDEVVNGKVDDQARITYIRNSMTDVHQAISEGVDVRGVFIWSFLDGWEFGSGLSARYGMVHIDHAGTQKRTPKASAYWYSEVIKTNGFSLPTP